MSACKDSDVLTEHIEDPVNGVLDEQAEPIYQEAPDAPEDPTRISTVESDNDNEAEQENTEATYDQQPNTDDETDEREQDETPDDYNATQGDEQSSEGNSASVTGERIDGSGSLSGDGEDASAADKGEGDLDSDENGKADNPNESGGSGGMGTTYDMTGQNATLPDDVSTIAATGQYAIIVQMLGGQGGLVATDAETYSTVVSSGAFPDEGFESVMVAWSGDGTTSGSVDVATVLAAGADCVLTDSTGSGLTEEDKTSLTEAGVDVVVMPDLGTVDTPDANITKTVQLIGDLLRGAPTQYDASDMATRYVQMHDETINACVQANGGYSYKYINNTSYQFIYQGTATTGTATANLSSSRVATAFVNSWTSVGVSSIVSQRTYSRVSMDYLAGSTDVLDCSDGVGLSVSGSVTSNFVLMDYYFQCSGVVNNAYEGAKPATSATAGVAGLPSAVVAGSTYGMGLEGLITSRSVPSALWFSQTADQDADDAWTTVGATAFPGVVVRDHSIADTLIASANKVNGYYNVGQPFYVYVMPSGLTGSWADGTVESFLIAPWSFGCFRSDNDLTDASTYVSNYCALFYRCDAAQVITDFYESGSLAAACPTS